MLEIEKTHGYGNQRMRPINNCDPSYGIKYERLVPAEDND